ncbi:unnamed protein product, partial [Prorocentrum cordatum]
MLDEHSTMQPQFSVFLARNDESLSTISFGGYQSERAASALSWTSVAMPELGYWQVTIQSVRIGGDVVEDCEAGRCRAILDTGTSLLGVPRQVSRPMQRLLARVPPPDAGDGDAEDDIDCRNVEGLDIEFDLGEQVIKVGAEDYSRPRPFNITANTTQGWELSCRSLLLPLDIEEPLGPLVFIRGPVLRKYLTVYDWGTKRVGIAAAGTPAGPSLVSAVDQPPADSLSAGAPLPSLPRTTAAAATLPTVVVACSDVQGREANMRKLCTSANLKSWLGHEDFRAGAAVPRRLRHPDTPRAAARRGGAAWPPDLGAGRPAGRARGVPAASPVRVREDDAPAGTGPLAGTVRNRRAAGAAAAA